MYKGIVLHTVGKVAFVLGNFVIQYFLGKLPAELYGVYGTIIAIINFDYLFLNNGVRQAVSHAITQNRYNVPNLIQRGMLYQLAIIAVVFVINFFGAPLLADVFYKNVPDPAKIQELTYYIRIAAFIIPFMGIYFVSLGVFNGFKLFVIEASIITVYPILKLLVIPFSGGVFSDPIVGAEMGFLVAGIAIMAISLIFLYRKRGLYDPNKPKIEGKTYLKSAFSFSLLFSVVSIIMTVDLLILQAVIGKASPMVGYYNGAVQFGKASYYLLGAFYIVVLPVVTKFYKEKQIKKAAVSIRDLLTIILAVVLPVTVIIAASSQTVLSVYYHKDPAGYATAGPALAFLSFGTFCLGMTLVFNMITSAANKKQFTTVLSVVMLIVFLIVCTIMTNAFLMTGTGASSLIVCSITMIVSAVYAQKIFGNFWEKKHIYILLVNAVLFALTKLITAFVPIPNLFVLLVMYAALYFVGFGIMRLFKIISVKQIMGALKKEKKIEAKEEEEVFDLDDNVQ